MKVFNIITWRRGGVARKKWVSRNGATTQRTTKKFLRIIKTSRGGVARGQELI
jgi:hypothetical protein